MRILAIMAVVALGACGVDGPPERPVAKPQQGVTVSGHATAGVVTEL